MCGVTVADGQRRSRAPAVVPGRGSSRRTNPRSCRQRSRRHATSLVPPDDCPPAARCHQRRSKAQANHLNRCPSLWANAKTIWPQDLTEIRSDRLSPSATIERVAKGGYARPPQGELRFYHPLRPYPPHLNRDSPDDSRFGVNVRGFPAFLQSQKRCADRYRHLRQDEPLHLARDLFDPLRHVVGRLHHLPPRQFQNEESLHYFALRCTGLGAGVSACRFAQHYRAGPTSGFGGIQV
jgi:hypothetical protein